MILRKAYSLIQKIIEYWNKKDKKEATAVYMFHRVAEEIDAEYKDISITINAFDEFINAKKQQGIEFVQLDKLQNTFENMCQAAVITFDDVFEDAYLYAIPILRMNKIPYTIFISPGLIGRAGYISQEQFEELKKDSLCTIGAHSLSHKILRELALKEKEKEISLLGHELVMKCSIEYFAYPYGSLYACDGISKKLVRKEYKYGFSTINSKITKKCLSKNSYYLPRINVNNNNYLKV